MIDAKDSADRRLEIALLEHFGGEAVPDLRYRVLAARARGAGAEEGLPAAAPWRRRWRRVAVAGALLYGVAVVVATASLHFGDGLRLDDGLRVTAVQDPEAVAQDPKEVLPTTLDAVRALLKSVEQVEVAARWVLVEEGLGRSDGVGTSVALARDVAAALIADVGPKLRADDGGVSLPHADVLLRLSGGRTLRGVLHVHHRGRLEFASAGISCVLPQVAADALRAAVSESVDRSQRTLGVVKSTATLHRTGQDALPSGLSRLRLLAGEDRDLARVGEFEALEHLDLSAAVEDLRPDTLGRLLGMSKLRSLVLSVAQFDVVHERLADARQLRDFGLSVLEPQGRTARDVRCVVCHVSAEDQKRGALSAAQLEALRAMPPLESLALRGLELPAETGAVLGDLPMLTSVDLRGSDLRKLQPSALGALPMLRHLELQSCLGVDDAFLLALGSIKSLRVVDLRWCNPAPSPEAVDALRRALPDCSVLQ